MLILKSDLFRKKTVFLLFEGDVMVNHHGHKLDHIDHYFEVHAKIGIT